LRMIITVHLNSVFSSGCVISGKIIDVIDVRGGEFLNQAG